MSSPSQLRRRIRAQRRALAPRHRHRRSLALCRHLARSPLFRNSRRIAFYLAHDGEIDLTPLLRRACDLGKTCYLPVLCDLGSRHLWFAPYRPGDPLTANTFGIPEPAVPKHHRVRARSLDLILAPLVAFDRQGNRMGMGGGFYDRTLAYLKQRHHWRRPYVLGVAYQFQQVERLSRQPWDIPLQGIATDAGLRSFSHDSPMAPPMAGRESKRSRLRLTVNLEA